MSQPLIETDDSPTNEADDSRSAIPDSRSASGRNRKTVLAIASAGGHWVQLLRLRPAFADTRLIFATTKKSYRGEIADAAFRVVPDCNRWQKLKLAKAALSIAWLILKEKPDVIVTTGAAPGYFAIRLGKLLGKKTVWIDSIANAEELSLSGQAVGKHADLWLTQWQHLARPSGPSCYGNVLGDEASQDPESVIGNRESSNATFNNQEPHAVASIVPNNQNQPDHRSATTDLSRRIPQAREKTDHRSPIEQSERSPISPSPREGSVGDVPSVADHRSPIEQSERSSITDPRSPIRANGHKKIFVTVGTDLPFDRLVRAIDQWAPEHPEFEVFAQIGETAYRPENIPFENFLEPPVFTEKFREADIVVSHAGMGTILSSLSYEKPLLVMPRIAAKGEHRNEHQLATAKYLTELNKVNVAQDEAQLLELLGNWEALPAKDKIGPHASANLTDAIRDFIDPDPSEARDRESVIGDR